MGGREGGRDGGGERERESGYIERAEHSCELAVQPCHCATNTNASDAKNQ